MTAKEKAFELYKKFRVFIIDHKNEDVNNEIATSIALLHIKELQYEFEHYFGKSPNKETRPVELSGKDFIEQVRLELQKLHKVNYTENK